MTATKRRTGVPPVSRVRVETPLIPEKKVSPPKPASHAVPFQVNEGDVDTTVSSETPIIERTTAMNTIKTAIETIKANRAAIARKALIMAGAAAGMLITSTVVDRMNRPVVDVFVVTDPTVEEDPANPNPETPVL